MQRDAEPVEEGRGGRLGKGLQGCTQTLKNQSVQSLGIIKRAYKQDGGLNTVTREVTWDREGKLANKNCTPETLEVPN